MKKIISLFTVVLLLISAFPLVSNAESYGIYLFGIEVTSDNANDIIGGGIAEYDADTNTLTFFDLNYIGEGFKYSSQSALDSNAGIYSASDLNIVFDAGNTITLTSTSYSSIGICVFGDLDISASSDSYLNITVGGAAHSSYGIYAQGDLTIHGGSYNIKTGDTSQSYGVSSGISALDTLEIDKANVEISTGYGFWYSSPLNSKGMSINDSTLLLTSANSPDTSMGIRCNGDYVQTNSNITITTPASVTNNAYGIDILNSHSFTINGGSLNADTATSFGGTSSGIKLASSTPISLSDTALNISAGTYALETDTQTTLGCSTYLTLKGGVSALKHTANPFNRYGSVKMGSTDSDAAYYSSYNSLNDKYLKVDLSHNPSVPVTENAVSPTMTEDGSYESVTYCTVCGIELSRVSCTDPAYAVKYEVDGFKIKLSNLNKVDHIRVASGYLETSKEIRSAGDLLQYTRNRVISCMDFTGRFTFTASKSGYYSFWIRYTDGETEIIHPEISALDQYITTNGVMVTVHDILDVKDYFIGRGNFTTYREIKKSDWFLHISPDKLGTKTEYTSNVILPGDYTICIRYSDESRPNQIIHFTCEVTEPEITQTGLQVTVTGLEGVKCIRTAQGEFSTAGEVKRAQGCRTFTAKNAIKDNDTYSFYYPCEGSYTITVEYSNGYSFVKTLEIAKLTPEIIQDTDSVTIKNVGENLNIIRYAPGTLTEAGQFKLTSGNKYIKPSAITEDEITISSLSGTWSFLVQYIDGSKNIFTLTF